MSMSTLNDDPYQIVTGHPAIKNSNTKKVEKTYEVPSPQQPYAKAKPKTAISLPVPQKSSCSVSNLPPLKKLERQPLPSVRRRTDQYDSSNMVSSELEETVDNFLVNSMNRPIGDCIEQFFLEQFKAKDVIFWQDIPTVFLLYAIRIKRTASHSEGLVGYTFTKKSKIILDKPFEHPAYLQKVDGMPPPPDSPVTMLLFPIWDHLGNIYGVVQITRPVNDPFTNDHEFEFIDYFTKKFKVFAPLFKPTPSPDSAILDMLQIMEIEQFLLIFQKKMESLFHCRGAEIWRLNKNEKTMKVYKKTVFEIDPQKSGIIGEALNRQYPVNCLSNRRMASYLESIDGQDAEPVLAVPIFDFKTNVVHAIALRGGADVPAFTTADEAMLKKITPYVILALKNIESVAIQTSNGGFDVGEHHCIETIEEMTDLIANHVSPKEIVCSIVEKMEMIAKADRTTLYAIDHTTSALESYFCTSKTVGPISPQSRTVPARAAASNQIININDAYEDLEFDPSIDIETGYKTSSILAIPMIGSKGDVLGVTEFLNRLDGRPFPKSDQKFLCILSQFAGFIFESQMLMEDVNRAAELLRISVNRSLLSTSGDTLKRLVDDCLRKLYTTTKSDFTALYLVNNDSEYLLRYSYIGLQARSVMPMSHGAPALCVKTKDSLLANDCETDPRVVKDPLDDTGIELHTLLLLPLLLEDGQVIGIIQLVNNPKGYTNDDISLATSIAKFLSIAFQNRHPDEVASIGNPDYEVCRWIKEDERVESTIPAQLELQKSKQMEADSLNYNGTQMQPNALIKLVFHVFKSLNIMAPFKITSEMLFKFIYKIREDYDDRSYHNFSHACDCCQFICFLLSTTNLHQKLTGIEVLCLIVASLTAGYGVKSFSTLSKDAERNLWGPDDNTSQEIKHKLLRLTKTLSDTNLFQYLDQVDAERAWPLLTYLVREAAPENRFTFLQQIEDIDWSVQQDRNSILMLIAKVAENAWICRPEFTCESWHALIRNEGGMLRGIDEICPPTSSRVDSEKQKEIKINVEIAKEQIAYSYLFVMPYIRKLGYLEHSCKDFVEFAEKNILGWHLNFFSSNE